MSEAHIILVKLEHWWCRALHNLPVGSQEQIVVHWLFGAALCWVRRHHKNRADCLHFVCVHNGEFTSDFLGKIGLGSGLTTQCITDGLMKLFHDAGLNDWRQSWLHWTQTGLLSTAVCTTTLYQNYDKLKRRTKRRLRLLSPFYVWCLKTSFSWYSTERSYVHPGNSFEPGCSIYLDQVAYQVWGCIRLSRLQLFF